MRREVNMESRELRGECVRAQLATVGHPKAPVAGPSSPMARLVVPSVGLRQARRPDASPTESDLPKAAGRGSFGSPEGPS